MSKQDSKSDKATKLDGLKNEVTSKDTFVPGSNLRKPIESKPKQPKEEVSEEQVIVADTKVVQKEKEPGPTSSSLSFDIKKKVDTETVRVNRDYYEEIRKISHKTRRPIVEITNALIEYGLEAYKHK